MSNKNKQIAKISVFITSIFVIILSISYAFITNIITGEKQVVINAGVLDLVLEEENNVTLTNAYPMYDEVGMIQEDSFDFKLVNKTKNDVNYTLYLEDVTPEYITGKCNDLGEITTSSPKECRKNNYPEALRKEVLSTGFDEGMSEEEALSFWQENIAFENPLYYSVETFEDIIDVAIDYVGMVEDTRTLIETYPENNYKKINIGFYHTGQLKYYLTNDGVGEVRQFPDVYKEDGHLEDVELDYGLIKGNQSINYSLRIWINSEVEDDFFYEYKMFSYKLKVEVNQEIELTDVLDLENKVDTTTEIDFSKVSSETNGRGIYKYTEDKEDIYYWRGAVTDNHIIFGGYCWEMIRTTKTGGVKMIYDGEPVDGKCTNTGETSQIGKSRFNTSANDNAYVGYMYGLTGLTEELSNAECVKLSSYGTTAEVGSETDAESCELAGGKWVETAYEATHANVVDSTVKKTIDEWFLNSNLLLAENFNKLEDTVYCNDRSIPSGSTGTGYGDSATYYSGYYRLFDEKTKMPSLECNKNDSFTVNSKNGNGDLTYPVGLLTADEAVLAGLVYHSDFSENDDKQTYLYDKYFIEFITPSNFSHVACTSQFHIYYNLTNNFANVEVWEHFYLGVRPVISLKSTTRFIKGGDGTESNPYVVK